MSDMNVSAVSSAAGVAASTYNSNSKAADKTADETKTAAENSINGTSAVYEPSKTSEKESKKTYGNPQLVQQLKMENEARVQQLQDIVNKLLTKQGNTYNTANGLKSIYENLVVDDATRAQAQADIAEDGYWGVNQTSERIFDFAKALSGGDPEKMEEMRKAFEKGYKQATKAWGDELPQICKDTYDSVMKKFDDYKAENEKTAAEIKDSTAVEG